MLTLLLEAVQKIIPKEGSQRHQLIFRVASNSTGKSAARKLLQQTSVGLGVGLLCVGRRVPRGWPHRIRRNFQRVN
jgi:hypothetical protein